MQVELLTLAGRGCRLIWYDAAGLSSGVCGRAFEHLSALLGSAADTIAACACEEGCPMCELGGLDVFW